MYEFCTICGTEGPTKEVRPNTANNFGCSNCRATLRFRALATSILTNFGKGRHQNLQRAVKSGDFDELAIWELSLRGPIKNILSKSKNYINSYYWEDTKLGEMKNNVICQDITNLTFDDNQFDLVLSSDVMEHVHEPWAGFEEVARVLKPSGAYIFTIPIRIPFRPTSVVRASLDTKTGTITHHLPEVYHNAGDGSDTLVFTDFGQDIFERLRKLGLYLYFQQPSTLSQHSNRFGAFVAVKNSN